MTEIKSTFWNSGFISCYNGTVYVSTHWDNMFGPIGDGDKPVMVQIQTNSDGKFDPTSVKYICNGVDNSYSSTLVKVGDLGFAQTGHSFMVFDLKDNMKIIAKTDPDTRLEKTYSNIAVAYGSEDLIYGYVSPAGMPTSFVQPVDGLICFVYKISTNEIKTFDLKVGSTGTTSTNSIKIGPNGEILFAKNDGVLYCITQDVPSYYVNFDANGGSGDMTRVDVSGEYTLPACSFIAPEGKKFLGWAYSPTGEVISGSTIDVKSNITLYAIWEDDNHSSPDNHSSSNTVVVVVVAVVILAILGASFVIYRHRADWSN